MEDNMSVSPTGTAYGSDEDWGSFDGDFDSTFPPSSVSSEGGMTQAARAQYDLLLTKEEMQELNNKPAPRQMLFFSTIYILASEGCFDLAEKTLFEADEKNIWQGFEEQRAKAYTHLIGKILEKGVHENANALYSRGIEGLAWEGFPAHLEEAKKALAQAGFHFD